MELPIVLIVEDDALIGSSLSRALVAYGFAARHVVSLREAREAVAASVPDLMLLDVMLPDGDGIDYCAQVNTDHPRLPVVMLTARTDEADVVGALRGGAVDYVAKPFRLAELIARIERQLQLAARIGLSASVADQDDVLVGALAIRTGARRVTWGGTPVDLRPREFDLLRRLAVDAGRVVTRERLIEDVWDEHWWGPTKTLDVHINALRRKLGMVDGGAGPISTVRGVGYRLDRYEDDEDDP